ncbi:MAG: Qat anti-phage system associated protein QatB [Eubacteriaceae bacterium]
MGTSASSNGPLGGVSFDPPWLDDIEIPSHATQPDPQNDPSNDVQEEPTTQDIVAPQRRFKSARQSLGNYARSGNRESLRKAIGHYSKTGMGGARNVAKRMRVSTRTAVTLYDILKSAREGTDQVIREWVSSLIARKATIGEIIDEIIAKVTPNGGSIDESACRNSMDSAIRDLITRDPEVNLFNISDDNIWSLIESFLGYEAFNRLCLDIGQSFEQSSLSPRDKVTRMNEMHDYLAAEIYEQLESLRQKNQTDTSSQLNSILQDALANTFFVYEGAL